MVIYKTTNLVNGLIYIGQKQTIETEKDLLKSNYYGSGKKLKESLKEFGEENFKREVIDNSNDFDDLNKKEEYWIEYYNATNPEIGYNIAKKTGKNFNLGRHASEKTKKLWSEQRKGVSLSKEHKIKLSNKNKEYWSKDENIQKQINLMANKDIKEKQITGLKEYWSKDENINTRRLQMIGKKNKLGKYSKKYIIETPEHDIIEIIGGKQVMEILKCRSNFFSRKQYKGYKLLEIIKVN